MPLAAACSDQAYRSDASLVGAARAGDTAALALLFKRHHPRLFATALSLGLDRASAEDAVHDTFLVALTRLKELREPEAAGGWLHSIVRNHCLMAKRGSRRFAGPEETERVFAELRDEDHVESRIEARELRDWVWSALEHLSEPIRATVMLRYFGNYSSYEDLAAIMGVPIGTIRSRLSDAKLRLSDLLLHSAGLGRSSVEELTEERRAIFNGQLEELYSGAREQYISNFAEDMILVWPSGTIEQGRPYWQNEMDDDCRSGVRIRPLRFLASGDVTVMEAAIQNPRDNPFHCPPGGVMVLFGLGERVRRLHVFFDARPVQEEG